jgi:chromosome segregation ATPase
LRENLFFSQSTIFLVELGYVDQVKTRISEIDVQLEQLEGDFRSEKMDRDESTEKGQSLKRTRDSLREELVRMDVVT